MLDEFLTYLEAERRYSPLTVRNYRRDIERFVAWLGPAGAPFDPDAVTAEDLRAWILYRTEREHIGAASMNREISSLRAFWRFLSKRKAVSHDIFRSIRTLRTPRRLPAFVPETRMDRLLLELDDRSRSDDFVEVRDALIVSLFCTSGIRLGELIAIDRQDLDPAFASLRVRGKGDKERIVPLLDATRRKIRHYLQTIESQNICDSEEKALFLTRKGKRISRSVVQRIVGRELKSGGVQGKRSPHVLRHTFATRLMDHGADMRDIQELLGHASLRATQVYTHNSIARLQRVYAQAHPREREAPPTRTAEPGRSDDSNVRPEPVLRRRSDDDI